MGVHGFVDLASQQFKIKALQRKPKTTEMSTQIELPERWQPLEKLLGTIDSAYAELRELSAENETHKAMNAHLVAKNAKLKKSKKSLKMKLREAPKLAGISEVEPGLARNLSDSSLEDLGPGFDARYSEMEAAFNLKELRRGGGEPSLATMSIAPDPDFGEPDWKL